MSKTRWNKKDPYFIYGLVGSKEWDWRKDAEKLAQSWWKTPFATVVMDLGKYLGLIQRLNEVEAKEESKEGEK